MALKEIKWQKTVKITLKMNLKYQLEMRKFCLETKDYNLEHRTGAKDIDLVILFTKVINAVTKTEWNNQGKKYNGRLKSLMIEILRSKRADRRTNEEKKKSMKETWRKQVDLIWSKFFGGGGDEGKLINAVVWKDHWIYQWEEYCIYLKTLSIVYRDEYRFVSFLQ